MKLPELVHLGLPGGFKMSGYQGQADAEKGAHGAPGVLHIKRKGARGAELLGKDQVHFFSSTSIG